MQYFHWLILASLTFVVLERLFPWRQRQPMLRRGLLRDLLFLALNGHFFAIWTGVWLGLLAAGAQDLLQGWGLTFGAPMATWAWGWQLLAAFLLKDFVQWCVHNLLHRVPALWKFHQVHHGITTMDWVGNFRFHWVEILVYKTFEWLPVLLLNPADGVLMTIAVVGTFWGHFNHSNLNVSLGPLSYVFNNPRMHLWHHDQSSEGGVAKNFAIVLSLWDWLFRTAYWPRDRSPERLGYPGIERMPESFVGEVLWPLFPATKTPRQ